MEVSLFSSGCIWTAERFQGKLWQTEYKFSAKLSLYSDDKLI